MPKLMKSLIDQSPSKDKDYYIWDSEVKGFGCRIWPSGKKTYMFLYRSFLNQKKIFFKIGVHGNITVDEARIEAKKLSASVASGYDPREQKQEKLVEEKQSLLFGDFFPIFKEKYMTTAYKDQGHSKRSLMNVHILPFFEKKKLGDITPRDIRQFLESLSHMTPTANCCFTLLSVMFKKAEEWEYLSPKSNPCSGIAKYKPNSKQRFLSRPELLKLEESLNQQEREQKRSYYTVNAIRLGLYLGCRKRNILDLKWKDVHLKEHYIFLPNTKTGESACPLNKKACDLLVSLKRQEGNPYVFPGRVPGKQLKEIKRAWRKVLKWANIKDFRVHDLRHSFASLYLSQGVDLYTVSKLLGHKNIATTTRYAHLELEHLKKATNIGAEVFG